MGMGEEKGKHKTVTGNLDSLGYFYPFTVLISFSFSLQ